MDEVTRVPLAKCHSYYDEGCVTGALAKALGLLGGVDRFVQPGQKVLLKVNLLGRFRPEEAVTTHPALVKALVRIVREAGGNPLIGDAPGGSPTEVQRVFEATGMGAIAEALDCPLINLSATKSEEVDLGNRFLPRIRVSRAALEADVLVSVGKLKTHTLTLLTGAVKNMFGVVPGRQKAECHLRAPRPEEISELLVDLYARVKPHLSILDAVVGMEGDGPSSGRPRPIGIIGASQDAVALDAVAAAVVGFDPAQAPILRWASLKKVGRVSLEEIEVVGEELSQVAIRDFLPPSTSSLVDRLAEKSLWKAQASVKLEVEMEKCEGCGLCWDSCPAGVIQAHDGRLAFDEERCIKCFCCQELCPNHAIRICTPITFRGVLASYKLAKGLREKWRSRKE